MKSTLAFRSLAFATSTLVGLAACSTDETVYDDEPISGTADVTVSGVGVEDGTEGGLDLDNGNVPGSENDADLDPVDEDLGLNTDE